MADRPTTRRCRICRAPEHGRHKMSCDYARYPSRYPNGPEYENAPAVKGQPIQGPGYAPAQLLGADTDRPTTPRLDGMTDDDLDALYERLRKAERGVNVLADAHRRAERAEALLAEYVQLADITHKYGAMGGHDSLGADLACAGCDLRDRARTALGGAGQPDCPGCGDTGACNGGPCAHPDAAPTR